MLAPLLLVVSLAAAPKTAVDALAAGRKAYDKIALEEALVDFESAEKLAPDDPEARVWVGVVLAEMGRFKDARAAFVDALKHGATALPDGVPPKTRGLFEAAKLDVEPPHPLPPDPQEHAPDASMRPAPSAERTDAASSSLGARATSTTRTPWILVSGGVVAAGAVVLVSTGAVLDMAAGPKMLDGGLASDALYGTGSALLVAVGALAIVGLVAGD